MHRQRHSQPATGTLSPLSAFQSSPFLQPLSQSLSPYIYHQALSKGFSESHQIQFPQQSHPNRLIRCVKEREKTLQQLRKKPDSKKLTSIADLKVDRWFLTRFSIDSPYTSLQEEFDSLETGISQWTQTARINSYITTPLGINSNRQLKINAQRIGPLYGREYIASEGPTMSAVYDFWTLVWQENVSRILSVNFPYEERLYPSVYDQAKETIQYWPIVPGEMLVFKPFHITCIETNMKISPHVDASSPREMVYRVTRLRLFYQNPVFSEQTSREILHFCYYRWPDGRLPIPWPAGECHSLAALELFDTINTELTSTLPENTPLLVHCHAGLGRTGVVIAVDVAIRQLEQSQTVGIANVVEKLREKRARAVMNPWQYAYINAVIAEKALQLGVLARSVGGHSSRALVDHVWQEINKEVNKQFNTPQSFASSSVTAATSAQVSKADA